MLHTRDDNLLREHLITPKGKQLAQDPKKKSVEKGSPGSGSKTHSENRPFFRAQWRQGLTATTPRRKSIALFREVG